MDFTPMLAIKFAWICFELSFVEEKIQIFKKSKRNNYGMVKN